MEIYIGSDHAGTALRYYLSISLKSLSLKHNIIELGPVNEEDKVDYPDIAYDVASKVLQNQGIGILICGTGVGISIAANKIKGIRCALVSDAYTARLSKEHNNANILALGSRVLGPDLALDIVKIWLETPFSTSFRHQSRLDKISILEDDVL